MPKLAIFNHELFARCYVRTDNASYAYRHAYGENIHPNDALTLGAQVLAIPEVAARIKEYQDNREELDRSFLVLGEWREFIANLTRTPIQDSLGPFPIPANTLPFQMPERSLRRKRPAHQPILTSVSKIHHQNWFDPV